MNPTPSIKQFRGLYNVSPKSAESGEGSVAAGCLQVTAAASLPPSLSELERILNGINIVAKEIATELDVATRAASRLIHGDANFNDRTAALYIRDMQCFRLSVLERYRAFLMQHEPHWRIVVEGASLETTIVIYPSAVIMPDGNVAIEEGFRRVCDLESGLRDAMLGDHERQWLLVQRRLQNAVVGLRRPFEPVVIAAFDRFRGREDLLAVWVLEDGNGFDKNSWLNEEAFPALKGQDHARDVDASGKIFPYRSRRAGVIGRVVCCVCSKEGWDTQFIFQSPTDQSIRIVKVREEDVISDRHGTGNRL